MWCAFDPLLQGFFSLIVGFSPKSLRHPLLISLGGYLGCSGLRTVLNKINSSSSAASPSNGCILPCSDGVEFVYTHRIHSRMADMAYN